MKLAFILIAILIAIIIALGVLYFYRINTKNIPAKTQLIKAKSTKAKSTNLAKSQFRCVVIVPGVFACEEAKAMRDKPILMNEAPVLPLSTCKAKKCVCKFTRHDDRRMNSRREAINAARQMTGNIDNKRTKKDRRRSTEEV
jgi:hypothetical protein